MRTREFPPLGDIIADRRTPFPHGATVSLKEAPRSVRGELIPVTYPWKVANTGWLIALTHTDPDRKSWVADQAKLTLQRAPAVANFFGYEKDGDTTTVVVPTAASALLCTSGLFRSLRTAGITPYQTSDLGQTKSETFLPLLTKARLMPVSLDPNVYLHDMFVHLLGDGSQEPDTFNVYGQLVDRREAVRQEFGEKAAEKYTAGLMRGHDFSSGGMLPSMFDPDTPEEEYPFLIGLTITEISKACRREYPEVVGQSMRLVEQSGLGTPTVPDNRAIYVVPEEHSIAIPHYRQVREILQQPAA